MSYPLVPGELVVVEIALFGIVLSPDIDNDNVGIAEILLRGITAPDWHPVAREKQATGEKVVFMGAAGVGQNCFHDIRKGGA